MGNENQSERSRPQPPHRARTLVVRWWRDSESNSGDIIRGVLRDIEGTSLGAFNDFSDLIALLRREAQREE